MARRKRWATAVSVVLGLGAASLAGPAVGSAAGSATQPAVTTADRVAGAEDSKGATVTLVTGDVVTVGSGSVGQVSVHAAPRNDGRNPAFSIRGSSATATKPAQLFVIPQDAQSLISAGKLDRSLFDVDLLRRNGFGTTSGSVPVISSFGSSVAKKSLEATGDALAGSTQRRVLESINASALTVPNSQAASFWRDVTTRSSTARVAKTDNGVQRLSLDRPVKAALDKSVPQVHAPEAWAEGYDGTGVKVAILDTGIDATHPDLAGKVIGQHNFIDGSDSVVDGFGHGTHVASIITGSGAASDGRYRGVAPGAKLLIGKVLGDDGSGSVSYLIDGAEWAADQGAQVVNMSIGGILAPEDDSGSDPLEQAIDLISRYSKTLFVIAAGNSGPNPNTVEYPGVTKSALTVGAVDSTDKLADFSSRGPLPSTYTRTLKPDLVAPGVDITAARAAGTTMGTPVDDYYTTASGTSMATPHVAGGAAILAQAHPDWTGQQIKQALTASTDETTGSVFERGTGRLNVERAVHEDVTTTAALDFGRSSEDQKAPVARDVTYANAATTATSLTLSASLHNVATGTDVPAAAITLPATLAVPAKGTATASTQLAVDGLAVGQYSGTLTATDKAGHTTRTAIGFVRDPFTAFVNVIIDARQLGGCPCTTDGITATNLDHPEESVTIFNLSGYLHLTPGRYMFDANVEFLESGRVNNAVLVIPEVEITGTVPVQSVHLQLARAQQVKVQTDRPTEAYSGALLFTRHYGNNQFVFGGRLTDYYATTLWALPTPKVSTGSYLLSIAEQLGAVPLTGAVVGGDRMAIHPWYMSYNSATTFPATVRARLVDVGDSLDPAEAKAVRGAIALASPPAVPGQGEDQNFLTEAQAQELAAAGAIGVLVRKPGEGTDASPYPISLEPPLPVAGLSNSEGNELANRLKAGPLKVDLVSTTPSPYLYSLKFYEKDSVPSSLTYHVTDSQLASIKTDFRSFGPEPTLYRSYDEGLWPAGGEVVGYAPETFVTAPRTVTKLVGPLRPGVQWFRWTEDSDTEIAPAYRYSALTAGKQKPEVMNPALLTPGAAVAQPAGDRPCSVCRSGDTLLVRPTGTYGDPTLIDDGYVYPPLLDEQAPLVRPLRVADVKLYSGQKQIPMAAALPQETGKFDVPATPADLRLVYDRTAAENPLPYGQALHAEWSFRTERPTSSTTAGTVCPAAVPGACGIQPLLQVRPDVALDNHNQAPRAGGKLTLTAYHESSTETPAQLSSMAVKVSFDDGKSWSTVKVSGSGDVRTVTVPRAPAKATAVSLQVQATDKAGSKVSLVLPRAYGLAG
ncbi:S8 family peptidase [Kribbella sp. NPDC051952]|uniref:S8 family peptidase n=1 Tax=Kribbella sp. NPDC051952 TaxID=3154851 RepID=UPI00343381B9